VADFTPKEWQDGSEGGTPISAEALIDLETRTTDFATSEAELAVAQTFSSVVTVVGPLIAEVRDRMRDVVVSGALSVAAGALRYGFPYAATIVSVSATVGTAPTGTTLIVDVHKNGTTIFTTQANRPTIAISANVSSTATPDVVAIAAGDYLTVDVDQIGSGTAGSNLVVTIWFNEG
jgi:hypothetical protein